MTVAAQANALVTKEEAAAFLSAPADDALQEIVNRASDYCDQWRPWKEREYESLRFAAPSSRSRALWMRGTPINVEEAVVITLGGVAQTIWRTEADGDPGAFDVIVRSSVPGDRFCPDQFWRAAGWFSSGSWAVPDPIVVSYTGGLVEIPGDVKEAAFLVVQNIVRQKRGLTDVGQMSGPAIGQTAFIGAQGSLGSGQGLSLIPMKAKQILDHYRLVPV